MRVMAVKSLQDGMVLGRSIYSFNNKLLLGAGFRLTEDFKSRLIARGHTHIYIMEEGTEDVIPEDIISDQVRMQAKSTLDKKAEDIQGLFRFKETSTKKVFELLKNGYLKNVNINFGARKIAEEILVDISSVGAYYLNTILFKSEDTYELDHAINVTLLSILIGKKYGFQKTELQGLAVGAFLHDFGKIVTEKMKNTANSGLVDDLIKEHPTFGYLLVSNTPSSSPITSQIVIQHHEHQDGTGYPLGLKGDNLPPVCSAQRNTKGTIFRFAEIVSVADAYDKFLMNPKNEIALTPIEAMKQLLLGAGTRFNKHIVNILSQIVPLYPIGVSVKINYISDPTLIGYRGVVAKINDDHLNKPVIVLLHDRSQKRITPRLIDTSKLQSISLELVL